MLLLSVDQCYCCTKIKNTKQNFVFDADNFEELYINAIKKNLFDTFYCNDNHINDAYDISCNINNKILYNNCK